MVSSPSLRLIWKGKSQLPAARSQLEAHLDSGTLDKALQDGARL